MKHRKLEEAKLRVRANQPVFMSGSEGINALEYVATELLTALIVANLNSEISKTRTELIQIAGELAMESLETWRVMLDDGSANKSK